MITHRMSTQPPEPPVRFYKIIALSFLVITIALLGVVIFITSKKADIVIVAKEDTAKVNLSISVGKGERGGSIAGQVTSNVFYWSQKYQPTGNKKVEDIATGEVVLYNKSSVDQTLVKKTQLITGEGIIFRLSKAVVVPAQGQITVSVYADKVGASSEIGPSQFTVLKLNPAKQKLVYAESTKAMSGGIHAVGVLSAEDIKNAEIDYRQKVKEAFVSSYVSAASTTSDWVIAIADQSVKTNAEIGNEVGEFFITGTSTVVVVAYDKENLIEKINKEIENKIDNNSEKILSVDKKPEVTIAHYNLKEGTAELNVSQDATVTLDANGEKLLPERFVGKRKEEIQRYALGLSHVSGVEVRFHPSWMISAPTVPDKIRVIVKSVK